MSMPAMTEDLKIKLCGWVYGFQGVHQVVFEYENEFYLANETTGVRPATQEDIDNNPLVDPPIDILEPKA